MKNWIKYLLIVELQVLLLLFVVMLFKINEIDRKVFNTNKFIHEQLVDKRIEELNTIRENDIVIGNINAPVTMVLYSRFDCSACNDFFANNYDKLKDEFIKTGVVKLVVRYLTHESKPQTLYAVKCAYYANNNGVYDLYIKSMHEQYPDIDTSSVNNVIANFLGDNKAPGGFLNGLAIEKNILDLATQTRKAGVSHTPTIFINKQKLVGNRRYAKIKELIMEEQGCDGCE